MTGPEFRNRVQAIMEAFIALKRDLDSERRAMENIWAKREKQIGRVVSNIAGMRGDLEGIVGPNRLPELKASLEKGLEHARNKLAFLISKWNRRHPDVECVIIFDGDIRFTGGHDQRLAGIRCIFSQTSHGGDEAIIRFVRECQQRTSDITVVSDDNYVRNNCRAHGASVQPSSYIASVKAPPLRRLSKSADGGKGIDKKSAAKIDEELRKKFGL